VKIYHKNNCIMRKSVFVVLIGLLTYGLIGVISCTKPETNDKSGAQHIMSQEESPIIGTFESGLPEILLSDIVLDSIISWAFSTEENIVSLADAYIDDIEEEGAPVYLVIEGIDQYGTCMTMGLTLDRDLDDFNYYLAAVGGSKWKCRSDQGTCKACVPERNWAHIVTSCQCTKPLEDPPHYDCVLEREQGNWVAIAAIIWSIIQHFLTN